MGCVLIYLNRDRQTLQLMQRNVFRRRRAQGDQVTCGRLFRPSSMETKMRISTLVIGAAAAQEDVAIGNGW